MSWHWSSAGVVRGPSPGPAGAIDTDGLALTYSKLKLHSGNAAADPRLRIELVGKLLHAKVIEQRP